MTDEEIIGVIRTEGGGIHWLGLLAERFSVPVDEMRVRLDRLSAGEDLEFYPVEAVGDWAAHLEWPEGA